MNEQITHTRNAWPHLIGALMLLILILWFASWTGPGQPSAADDSLIVLVSSVPLTMAWIAAAMGYGWLLCRFLAHAAHDQVVVQLGLGSAAMFVIDEVAGVLGMLQFGGSLGGWMVIAMGIVLLTLQLALFIKSKQCLRLPHWLIWTAAPSLAVLLVSACSAPGVLWASEFGGYDALSYHLQLPKEWLALGRIEPLQHNVYSFLPNYVEAAYYHLCVLKGDAIAAAYSCQLLHASLAIMTAIALARTVNRLFGSVAGTVAAVLLLGTPWVIVVGSLAYNEMAMILMLVLGFSVIHDAGLSCMQRGSIMGIICGSACGAKLTAVGLVVAPLLVILLMNNAPRLWLRILLPMLSGGILVLLPYFLRNFAHAGNPLFPFATGIFGAAHWSAEQIATWKHGHFSSGSLMYRATEFWHEFMMYGMGNSPRGTTKPWKPQWSILPWIGVGSMTIALSIRTIRIQSARIVAMFVIQIAFWLAFTHLKSRFLLAVVVPLVIATGQFFSAWRNQLHRPLVIIFTAVVLTLWSMQPALLFRTEANGAPAISIGAAGVMSGDTLNEDDCQQFGATVFPAVAMNYLIPRGAKILSIGFATPFYVRADIAYATTWDRGLMSRVLRILPGEPDRWVSELHHHGVTHMIVNETMLEIWERSGWNDPKITASRVREFAQRHGVVLYQYPDRVTIYRLRAMENTRSDANHAPHAPQP